MDILNLSQREVLPKYTGGTIQIHWMYHLELFQLVYIGGTTKKWLFILSFWRKNEFVHILKLFPRVVPPK